MSKILKVDIAKYAFDIHRNLSVSARQRKPGPPEWIDGMTLGIITMERNAPARVTIKI